MNDEQVKRVKIPTDAQVVREFIAEAEAFRVNAEDRDAMTDAAGRAVAQGNLDARLALASRLEYVKAQRAALTAEAADQIAEKFAEAGRKIAASVKTFTDKMNDKTE